MAKLTLNAPTTALVLIDLQRGIVARPAAPHPAAEVIKRAAKLTEAFRRAGSLVVLVRVHFSADNADRLMQAADAAPPVAPVPPDFGDILPEIGPRPGDIIITKRQWGAFYGTELDLQLRRRGIHTLVLGGIATNFGVESTARDGWERGYELVFVEDATSALTADAHQFAFSTIFPRLGMVRTVAEVLAAIG
jgi:nicotinamidase-related amidase